MHSTSSTGTFDHHGEFRNLRKLERKKNEKETWERPFRAQKGFEGAARSQYQQRGCPPKINRKAWNQKSIDASKRSPASVQATRNWEDMTSKHPQSPQKCGKWILLGPRTGPKVFSPLLILGRRQDHPMIFHIFTSFYRWFFVSNCSTFCVLKTKQKNETHCTSNLLYFQIFFAAFFLELHVL